MGGGWAPYTFYGDTNNPSLRHDDHVHVSLFDQGGFWPSGTVGMNLSGDDEYVLNSGQKASIDQLIRTLEEYANGNQNSGQRPLVGGNLVLQAREGAPVEEQLSDALFKLRTLRGAGGDD